jgi:membrane-bound lytic murein transglycosylase B
MNVVSKKASRESVAQSVFANAAHELFAHGREVFETRTEQLKRVAQKTGVNAPALDMSFDERVTKWHNDYT